MARYCTALTGNKASIVARTECLLGVKNLQAGKVAGLRLDGHPTRLLAREVGARGPVSTSAYDAMKQLGQKAKMTR